MVKKPEKKNRAQKLWRDGEREALQIHGRRERDRERNPRFSTRRITDILQTYLKFVKMSSLQTHLKSFHALKERVKKKRNS
jgi:hypothetical protein